MASMNRYDNDVRNFQGAVARLRPALEGLMPPLDAGIDLLNEMRRFNNSRGYVAQPDDSWFQRRAKDFGNFLQRRLFWRETQLNHYVGGVSRRVLMAAHETAKPSRELLVLVPYDIADHTTGGASRLYGLARHLANRWQVRLLTLVSPQRDPEMIPLYPNVELYCVPRTSAFERRIESLRPQYGRGAELLALEEGWKDLPLLTFWTERLAHSAAAIMADGPPLLSLYHECGAEKPLIFESPNVYMQLLHSLGGDRAGEKARELEAKMLRSALATICVSAGDRDDYVARHGVLTERIHVIQNGVECARSLCFGPAGTRRAKSLARVDYPVVLFVGSNHLPNLDAVDFVLRELVQRQPSALFVFAGVDFATFTNLKGARTLPENALFTGKVSEADKECIFALSDIALCPVESGSGSSLKVPDYAAHGKPILSTPFGVRGFDELSPFVRLSDISNFAERLDGLLRDVATRDERLELSSHEARLMVERLLDWSVLAPKLDDVLSRVAGP